jgi:hypothetical protein
MIHVHEADSEDLARILGIEEGLLPNDLREEVALCTHALHRAGASGRLGTISLIAACRRLGYAPPEPATGITGRIDWRKIPTDGRALVYVDISEEEKSVPGIYTGPIACGTLGVRVNGAEKITEFNRIHVALSDVYDEPITDLESIFGGPPDAVDDSLKWEDVEEGAPLLAEIDEEAKDARFVKHIDEDIVSVRIDGEHKNRRLPKDSVAIVSTLDDRIKEAV